MKKIISEIRLTIAEWLITKAMNVAPQDTEDGKALISYAAGYWINHVGPKLKNGGYIK